MIVAVAAAAAMAQSTGTSTTSTQTINFPVFGLASSETAQINVINLASNSSSGTAASCSGTIAFYKSGGAIIGTAASYTVTAGQIASVAMPFGTVGATNTSTGRAQLLAVVTLTRTTSSGSSSSSSSSVPCTLGSSLEIFDTATGATRVVLSGDSAGGNAGSMPGGIGAPGGQSGPGGFDGQGGPGGNPN